MLSCTWRRFCQQANLVSPAYRVSPAYLVRHAYLVSPAYLVRHAYQVCQLYWQPDCKLPVLGEFKNSLLKGTVSVISSDLSWWQCPIYNVTLETFICYGICLTRKVFNLRVSPLLLMNKKCAENKQFKDPTALIFNSCLIKHGCQGIQLGS